MALVASGRSMTAEGVRVADNGVAEVLLDATGGADRTAEVVLDAMGSADGTAEVAPAGTGVEGF
jgi:hypothetical protein